MHVPEGPGLGVHVDEAKLGRYRVKPGAREQPTAHGRPRRRPGSTTPLAGLRPGLRGELAALPASLRLGVNRPSLKAESPDLTDVQLGWLDALFNVTYALGQVPGGMAGDWFGPRVVLTVLLVVWSGSLASIAMAGGFIQLALARAGFGLAQAGVYPNLSKVTKSWFAPAIRTTVQGFVASLAGRAGGACDPLIVASLLMGVCGFPWRESLVILASGGVALGLLFCVFFRNTPDVPVEPVPRRLSRPTRPDAPIITKTVLNRDPRWPPTFAMLLTYAAASTFADQLFVFWIPQFLIEGKGLTAVEMGLFAGLPLWGGALGGLVGGILNDVLIRWTGSAAWAGPRSPSRARCWPPS